MGRVKDTDVQSESLCVHCGVLQTGQTWTDLGEGKGVAPAAALPPKDLAAQAHKEKEQIDDEATTESEGDDEDVDDSAGYSSDASLSSLDIPPEARPGVLRRTSSASIPGSPSPPPEVVSSSTVTDDDEAQQGDEALTSKEKKKQRKKASKQKGDVWIYVSDSHYNLYLGIKQKGYFQHSSFLAGGPITSAGTLVIKDGVLIACNPMSGHYRTKAVYFKRFIEELEREGADLSQVKVGQTEVCHFLF